MVRYRLYNHGYLSHKWNIYIHKVHKRRLHLEIQYWYHISTWKVWNWISEIRATFETVSGSIFTSFTSPVINYSWVSIFGTSRSGYGTNITIIVTRLQTPFSIISVNSITSWHFSVFNTFERLIGITKYTMASSIFWTFLTIYGVWIIIFFIFFIST